MKVLYKNSVLSFQEFGAPDYEGEMTRTQFSGNGGCEWWLPIDGVAVGDVFYVMIKGDIAMPTLTGSAYAKNRSSGGGVISNVVSFPNGVSDSYSNEYSATITITVATASGAHLQYYSDVTPGRSRKLYVKAWKTEAQ